MIPNCSCGLTGGCEICNPHLNNLKNNDFFINLKNCIIIPSESIHRQYVEKDLKHWNRKMGNPENFGFYIIGN